MTVSKRRVAMNALLDRAPCGLLTFVDDGTIVDANGTLLAWLGYGEAELCGSSMDMLLSIAGRIFHQTHFFPLLRVQGHAEEIYIVLKTRSGLELPVVTNAVRSDRDGRAVNDCAFLPLRQRRLHEAEILRAKRAAEAANLAKDKFLSMMSHDLRTPLQAIMATTALLAKGAHGPLTDAQRKDTDLIERASGELLRLITDVLEFARLESGQVNVHVMDVPVVRALARAEALIVVQMGEAGLHYERVSSASLQTVVQADPDRLQQILLNLLSNALKFTPRGGTIEVSCERLEGAALLHVRDTGPGIAPDQLERIFQPFVQIASASASSAKRGVGLGLAISRDLARAMGGDLTAFSRPGEGAIFTLRLRTAESPA